MIRRVTLAGPRSRRVHLRPVTESDLPVLFEHRRDPEANAMAAFPPREHDAFAAHWSKILATPSVVAVAVVIDDRVAGNIGSWTSDGQRFVGYWLGREYWGRGIATEAMLLFLKLVTERPLYACLARHNVASQRVLEKCGFTHSAAETAALPTSEDGVEELVYVLDG